MKTVMMFCGLPAVGKSRFVDNIAKYVDVISTDNLIEEYAKASGLTYNDVFSDYISTAEKLMWSNFERLISEEKDFVIDRTNLNVKSRKKFLDKLNASGYKVNAYFIHKPSDKEWNRRLNNRPGKNIPSHVIESMMNSIVLPTKEEGFNEVMIIDQN